MEGPTPTAGGDAPIVEVTKADCIDNPSSQSTNSIKPAHVDRRPENIAVTAGKCHSMSTEVNAEANASAEGVADPGTITATNTEDLKEDSKRDTIATISEKKVRVARLKQN